MQTLFAIRTLAPFFLTFFTSNPTPFTILPLNVIFYYVCAALTSDNQAYRMTREGVLRVEVARCDLTFPAAVVELELSRPNPNGAISALLGACPLVLMHVHADGLHGARENRKTNVSF